MFVLHKKSFLVSLTHDLNVADYERRLQAEGLTGGYRPVAGYHTLLSACLKKRIPNFYFVKYGGIDDLCAGGQVHLPNDQTFEIKTAPRAATGPDLRKYLIGNPHGLAELSQVTLRVYPLPEYELWGLCFFDSLEDCLSLTRRMIGALIRPVFMRILEKEEATGLFSTLNLPLEEKTTLAFKLAGLKTLVEAEKEVVRSFGEEGENLFFSSAKPQEMQILESTLVTKEGFFNFMEKAGSLLGVGESQKTKRK